MGSTYKEKKLGREGRKERRKEERRDVYCAFASQLGEIYLQGEEI